MYVKYIDNGTNQYLVDIIYYDPTGVPQEILDQCFQVDTIPEAQTISGKYAVQCCDPTAKTVFYAYQDIMVQVSQADLSDLKEQNAQMILALVTAGLM